MRRTTVAKTLISLVLLYIGHINRKEISNEQKNGYLYRVHMNDGNEFVVYLETNTDYIVR